jgi:hypothetical protein
MVPPGRCFTPRLRNNDAQAREEGSHACALNFINLPSQPYGLEPDVLRKMFGNCQRGVGCG